MSGSRPALILAYRPACPVNQCEIVGKAKRYSRRMFIAMAADKRPQYSSDAIG